MSKSMFFIRLKLIVKLRMVLNESDSVLFQSLLLFLVESLCHPHARSHHKTDAENAKGGIHDLNAARYLDLICLHSEGQEDT